MEVPAHYSVGQLLGRGSYGVVYMGIHKTSRERVALKRLENDEPFAATAETEIKALSKLYHPNIVKLLGFETDSKYLWIVTELCDLRDLEHYLLHHEPTWKQKLKIMYDCATGLDFMHSKKVVHRDLTLKNIVMKRNGTEIVCKISDFGMAKIAHDSSNLRNIRLKTKIGAISFWAPELWASDQKQYTFHVDNFAIGLVFLVVMEYSSGRHQKSTNLLPEDYVFKDSSEVQHCPYGQELDIAFKHGDPMPVLFELKSDEEFPKADLKLIITKLTTFHPQKRMAISKVVYDLGCLLGSFSSHTDQQTRQQDQMAKLREDIENLKMRTEEQETEMRRLRDENMQLKHQIKCQKPEKKILGMELPPEVKPKTRLTSSNQRVSQVEVSQGQTFDPDALVKLIPGFIDCLNKIKEELDETKGSDPYCRKVVYHFGIIHLDMVCGLQNIYLAKHEIQQRFDDIPPPLLAEAQAKVTEILDILAQMYTIRFRLGREVAEFFSSRYYSLKTLFMKIKSTPVYLGFFCSHLKPHKLIHLPKDIDNPQTKQKPNRDLQSNSSAKKTDEHLAQQCKQYELQIKKLESDLQDQQKDCCRKEEEIKALRGWVNKQKAQIKHLEMFIQRGPKMKSLTSATNPLNRRHSMELGRSFETRTSLDFYAKQKLQGRKPDFPNIKEQKPREK